MRTRYFRDSEDNSLIKAVVYERADHDISKASIDVDACKICARLEAQGHQAYIVGGAVRDLLLGRTPKDFDIATNALPNRVKKLFRNSRIIGKRFRLVHIFFQDGKIHEVATFRAPESGDRNHVFGTLREDVMRRDFSLNALYYDPSDETIIDFVGGVEDIRKGILKSVLPLENSFIEDPVRMLRAVKYATITGMRIAGPVGRRIKKQAALLASASVSRLSEELFKILKGGNSESIFRLMDQYRLLEPLLPNFHKVFTAKRGNLGIKEAMFLNLAQLDQSIFEGDVSRGVMIYHFTEDVLDALGVFQERGKKQPLFLDVVSQLKKLLSPLVQPNRDVEEAVRLMFAKRDIKLPRKKFRYPEKEQASSQGDGLPGRKHRQRRPAPPQKEAT